MHADRTVTAQTRTDSLERDACLIVELIKRAVITLVDGLVFSMIRVQSIRAEDRFRNPAKPEGRIFVAIP